MPKYSYFLSNVFVIDVHFRGYFPYCRKINHSRNNYTLDLVKEIAAAVAVVADIFVDDYYDDDDEFYVDDGEDH